MFLELVIGLAVLALWDYGRRRLASHALRQDKLSVEYAAQQTKLLERTERLALLAERVDEAGEYQRRVLAAFINSATDILTISEEEKKHLRNKLTTSKLNK